jgi:alkanesulfonate monooxygenase SsuD/methylene tetrahydromethanopterin reductase-like flavin-dependent oxidoreductase (luciferase family)
MRRVQFGWIAPVIGTPESQYNPIVVTQQQRVLPAVAEHFDSIWVYDHFYGFERPSDPYLECWTTLTWLAAHYPGLQLGALVMGVNYRNPALVARMASTLQLLSQGRLVVGIGAGWREEEHIAYGYPFPGSAVRIQQLEEAVHIIRRMLAETAPTFQGRHFEIRGAYCPPLPSPPPPILIGGDGEQLMLPLIARLADWWNVGTVSVESFRRKRDILHRHAEAAGRDPADIVHSYHKNDAALPGSSGESERMRDELRPLIDLGITHFMIDFGYVTEPEPVIRYAEEVIGPLNAEGRPGQPRA